MKSSLKEFDFDNSIDDVGGLQREVLGMGSHTRCTKYCEITIIMKYDKPSKPLL